MTTTMTRAPTNHRLSGDTESTTKRTVVFGPVGQSVDSPSTKMAGNEVRDDGNVYSAGGSTNSSPPLHALPHPPPQQGRMPPPPLGTQQLMVAPTVTSSSSVTSTVPLANLTPMPVAQATPSSTAIGALAGNTVSSLNGKRIRAPHPHDVLCGRGGGINSHPGNRTFRDWVRERKQMYNLAKSKAEKARVSREIVDQVRKLNPPGRFLTKEGAAGVGWWMEIDDVKAMAKTSQALREGAPSIRAAHQAGKEKGATPSKEKKGGKESNSSASKKRSSGNGGRDRSNSTPSACAMTAEEMSLKRARETAAATAATMAATKSDPQEKKRMRRSTHPGASRQPPDQERKTSQASAGKRLLDLGSIPPPPPLVSNASFADEMVGGLASARGVIDSRGPSSATAERRDAESEVETSKGKKRVKCEGCTQDRLEAVSNRALAPTPPPLRLPKSGRRGRTANDTKDPKPHLQPSRPSTTSSSTGTPHLLPTAPTAELAPLEPPKTPVYNVGSAASGLSPLPSPAAIVADPSLAMMYNGTLTPTATSGPSGYTHVRRITPLGKRMVIQRSHSLALSDNSSCYEFEPGSDDFKDPFEDDGRMIEMQRRANEMVAQALGEEKQVAQPQKVTSGPMTTSVKELQAPSMLPSECREAITKTSATSSPQELPQGECGSPTSDSKSQKQEAQSQLPNSVPSSAPVKSKSSAIAPESASTAVQQDVEAEENNENITKNTKNGNGSDNHPHSPPSSSGMGTLKITRPSDFGRFLSFASPVGTGMCNSFRNTSSRSLMSNLSDLEDINPHIDPPADFDEGMRMVIDAATPGLTSPRKVDYNPSNLYPFTTDSAFAGLPFEPSPSSRSPFLINASTGGNGWSRRISVKKDFVRNGPGSISPRPKVGGVPRTASRGGASWGGKGGGQIAEKQQ